MSKLFDLSGTVSVVTGATGHLGRAISEGLAQAGSDLALCSTSKEKADQLALELSESCGIEAKGFSADLGDVTDIRGLVVSIEQAFERIDCLVNNAYFGHYNTLDEFSFEEWSRGLTGAVSSPFFLLQACIPLLERSRGNVINIASMYGMVSPKPQNYEGVTFDSPANYGAGKAALLQLTRYAAVYLADKGIRVNAVSPGPFPSEAVQEDAEFIGRLARDVPLGRIGEPGELKGPVVFLASDLASYVTGHNLIVDGGWTIW